MEKIDNLPKTLSREIILVDDGSKDASREIIKNFSNRPDITIHLKDQNSGKGDSLKIGFKLSKGDYVIVQDSDLEYDPKDYFKLLEEAKLNPGTVIYGSRFLGHAKEMSFLHFIGNKLLTTITNLLFGISLTDMETCYKLFPGNFIRNVNLEANRFDFEPEITAKIIKSGLKIKEIPISYLARTHSEGKKITWRDGIHAISSLVKSRFYDK
jgi:glycosyltransferase involved in cell wall biosynthesis